MVILLVKEVACLEKILFVCFYCLCFVNEGYIDILEDHLREEGDPDIELEEYKSF